MKWTKATDRLPELDKRVALKFKGELTAGNFEEYNGDIACYMAHRGTYMRPSFIFIEWLDESLPASAEDEAARLYPYVDIANSKELTDLQRSAHITCAGMYTDTIDKLKNDVATLEAENKALIEEIQNWKDELKDQAREHRNNR